MTEIEKKVGYIDHNINKKVFLSQEQVVERNNFIGKNYFKVFTEKMGKEYEDSSDYEKEQFATYIDSLYCGICGGCESIVDWRKIKSEDGECESCYYRRQKQSS